MPDTWMTESGVSSGPFPNQNPNPTPPTGSTGSPAPQGGGGGVNYDRFCSIIADGAGGTLDVSKLRCRFPNQSPR